MILSRLTKLAAVLIGAAVLAGVTQAAHAAVTLRIEPATIELGDAARLTIAASGSNASAITPPMVAGLEFIAVAQSQQIESVNGVSTSTTSITYRVIAQQAGVFTIPGVATGSTPVVLTVIPGNGRRAATARGFTRPGMAQTGSSLLPATSTPASANGAAFVRLRLSKHELYVGETIPVDIQVGMRDGFVASLNGLPTLNGDAFTLNKLSSQPQRAEELIDGKPYTVLTWHSALAAVKPGALSLTIEPPLTVRMRTAARPDAGSLDEEGFGDLFSDPIFQNFFGGSTEKDMILASSPNAFTVLPLPAQYRPANFSGAVGTFSISSDVSDDKAAAGDPVTLRLRISGTGTFDRVTTPMLHDVEHWKTYTPTAKFTALDDIGYRGEKTFEQPVIATQSGSESLPALSFSWFDPNSRHYVISRTSPLSVAVSPASAGAAASLAAAPPSATSDAPRGDRESGGLRADHADIGGATASLKPRYYQPEYIALPPLLVVAFSGAWFWVRRREKTAAESIRAAELPSTDSLLASMEKARESGDTRVFFQCARSVLQAALASEWQLDPTRITLAEVEARLGASSVAARVFVLADEAAYAGMKLLPSDFQWWKQLVLLEINNQAMS
jgi:hypothetical protein